MRTWIILISILMVFLNGCVTTFGGQEVSQNNIPAKDSDSERERNVVEKLVVQRGQDIFVQNYPPVHQGIITSTKEVYTLAYRKTGEEIGIKTSKDLGITTESPSDSGTSEKDLTFVRLVQPPFNPEPGVNEFPRKDILLYTEPSTPDDVFVAIQNPKKIEEWRVLKVRGYGKWLKSEIDLYLSLYTGL